MTSVIERATARRLRRPAWWRLAILLVAAVAVVATAYTRSVAAQLDRALAHVGESAVSMLDEREVGSRWLVINGMRMSLHTEVVDEPLAEALERRARDCHPGERTPSIESILLSSLSVRTGVFEDDGYVACVELGERGRRLETFAEAAERFAANWDLAELGRLRYVYATRADEDPANRTFLFSVWSHGRLDLGRMVPRGREDAAGSDPPDVPRLPKSQRILSAYEAKEPSGVFTYRTDASSDEVLDFFRVALRRSGWRLWLGGDGKPIALDEVHVLAAAKGRQQVTVLCPASSSDSGMLTVLWSGERR